MSDRIWRAPLLRGWREVFMFGMEMKPRRSGALQGDALRHCLKVYLGPAGAGPSRWCA